MYFIPLNEGDEQNGTDEMKKNYTVSIKYITINTNTNKKEIHLSKFI